jgi:hypothetical protein
MLDQPTDTHHEQALRRASQVIGWSFFALVAAGMAAIVVWQLVARDRQVAAEAREALLRADETQRRALREAMPSGDVPTALRTLATSIRRAQRVWGRLPRDWGELLPREDGGETQPTAGIGALPIELDWGLELSYSGAEDRSPPPLAWEKTADRDGYRWVLFADLKTINRVSGAEFKRLRAPPGGSP